ncbi:hypothetical protein BH11MYX1_BH11MYX1_38640 [soil metagenome]
MGRFVVVLSFLFVAGTASGKAFKPRGSETKKPATTTDTTGTKPVAKKRTAKPAPADASDDDADATAAKPAAKKAAPKAGRRGKLVTNAKSDDDDSEDAEPAAKPGKPAKGTKGKKAGKGDADVVLITDDDY